MSIADYSGAVFETVARFGLQKTTMSDIAAAAGVSRQTLYNAYSSKDEVLRAAVKYQMDLDLQEVLAKWATQSEMDEKLDTYFRCGPVRWFDNIQNFPNASELMDGISAVIEPTLKTAHAKWIEVLADLLEEKVDRDQAEELADFLFVTAKNAKYSSENRNHLLKRIALLKEMVLVTYLGA